MKYRERRGGGGEEARQAAAGEDEEKGSLALDWNYSISVVLVAASPNPQATALGKAPMLGRRARCGLGAKVPVPVVHLQGGIHVILARGRADKHWTLPEIEARQPNSIGN
jgi:hypothetical protein